MDRINKTETLYEILNSKTFRSMYIKENTVGEENKSSN